MAKDAIVAIFDSRNQAYVAAREIIDDSDADLINLRSGAIVLKDARGNVSTPDTKALGSAWGTAGGAVVGGLIRLLAGPAGAAAGALLGGAVGATADLAGEGMKQDFIDTVGSQLTPGKSAVVAEVDEGSTGPIDRAVTRHGGRIYRTALES